MKCSGKEGNWNTEGQGTAMVEYSMGCHVDVEAPPYEGSS